MSTDMVMFSEDIGKDQVTEYLNILYLDSTLGIVGRAFEPPKLALISRGRKPFRPHSA